eukprot:TRINITY_DN22998_c0_g4_i3.p2 TRINITY_DN22998_c0_g4~~TRINITY_DN22998_c0_g4_i3.p2  ORF type:complete len:145 (-),score=5.53 TRINITY_DN22998_c0_g4_i3:456-890(-)
MPERNPTGWISQEARSQNRRAYQPTLKQQAPQIGGAVRTWGLLNKHRTTVCAKYTNQNAKGSNKVKGLLLHRKQQRKLQDHNKVLGKNGDLDDEQKRILRAVMYLHQKVETASYIRNILMRPPAPFQKKKAKFWEKFKGLEQIR